MAGAAVIIPILSEFNSAGSDKAIKSLKKLALSYGGAATAGALLVDVVKKSVQAYSQDQAAQKQLSLALLNTTGATTVQTEAVERNIASLEGQYHVADDQLRPALANLARITGSLTESQDLLETSLQVSAATGRDLESVSLAVGKAYQGNFKALRSMGIAISDTTLKNKDFNAAMAEVKKQTDGAAKAAADSAQGAWNQLSIAVGNLSEELGQRLAPPLAAAASGLVGLSQQVKSTKDESERYLGVVQLLKDGWNALQHPLAYLNGELMNFDENLQEVTNTSAGLFRMYEETGMKAWGKIVEDNNKKTDAAKSKLADLAKTVKGNLADALTAAKAKLKSLKDESASLAGSLRDTISGYVSLSDAVDKATTADDDYNQALRDRADAYAELNKLQDERKRRGFDINDQITYDAEQYADALDAVAKAEDNVKTAQAKKVDYASAFRAQIASAKEFATDLKALANGNPPLGLAGIQQLLNAGPIAGDAIAKELLKGTGGLTVAGLNADLTSLGDIGQQFGDVTATGVFGTAIGAAQKDVNALKQASVKGGDTNVYIQVTSADPNAVVDALKKYMKQNGSIPIKVKQQ